MIVSMRSHSDRLLDAMRILRTVNPEITVLYAAIFLEVGAAAPKAYPMNELLERFGITRATASRAVSWLSNSKYPSGKDRLAGHGLIKAEENEQDRRRVDLYLTAKGRTLHEQVMAALERK
jgi:DNA-binding MarR family transcriptional regulator